MHFNKVYRRGVVYRATGISLRQFEEKAIQHDLFGESDNVERCSEVFKSVDKMAKKFGEHTLYLGSSHLARRYSGSAPEKHLDIPFLGVAR